MPVREERDGAGDEGGSHESFEVQRPVREVRLEGIVLWLAAGVLVAALTAAFLLGRFVERQSRPQAEGREPAGATEETLPPTDVSETATRFDATTGGETQAEPQREVGSAQAPAGRYQVQVFAGRDRSAVEQIVGDLESHGYVAHVVTEREGTGSLMRVRVGGYATRKEALEAAERLKTQGHPGAYVPP